MILLPRDRDVPLRDQNNGPANPQGGGMFADLGAVPPLPVVPPVSVHYREEQDFEWAPGRDRRLPTGGPGGQNVLLFPLINKVSTLWY